MPIVALGQVGYVAKGLAFAVVGTGIGCFGLYLLARARHVRPRTLTS